MKEYLPTIYQQFIYKSRYSRWLEEQGRRENWPETVARYFNFFESHLKEKYNYVVPKEQRQWLEGMVLSLKVMPSMRALMTAGPALQRENMAAYNCSYIPIDDPRSFDEVLYILMNGTGVGFSVETQNVQRLPPVPETIHPTDTVIVVADSKIGWASALRELIALLYAGKEPKLNTSKVRPAGSRLKTFGGRASGPEPLQELFRFVIEIFKKAAGRKLTTLECHDIVCKIAEIVVVGGVRRSALVSLGDLNDNLMRHAKTGQWWIENPQRALANNSWVATERPTMETFFREWSALYESKAGERGIFSRYAAKAQMERFGRRNSDFEWGSNPCLEQLLRPYGVCNLSEAVLRSKDNEKDILEKLHAATIFGTWQGTLDNFKFIRKRWSDNQQEERLLGVSLTGYYDWCSTFDLSNKALNHFRDYAIRCNAEESEKLGMNPSAATTCIKPSGTVSQLVDASSGMHPRHSQYYVRTVRGDKKDPLTQFLIDKGVPCENDILNPQSTVVFSFPIQSPNSVYRRDLSAIDQLEMYKFLQSEYCEHKPSVTINVKEHEWLEVGAWVYKNIDDLIGVSFLPDAEHTYKQAPYQDCSKEEYEVLAANFPSEINWDELQDYEKEDNTVGSQEYACSSGFCEIA